MNNVTAGTTFSFPYSSGAEVAELFLRAAAQGGNALPLIEGIEKGTIGKAEADIAIAHIIARSSGPKLSGCVWLSASELCLLVRTTIEDPDAIHRMKAIAGMSRGRT